MSYRIEPAEPGHFLPIAALDRVAWQHTGEPFIADGEHVWRVWCEYATVLVARIAAQGQEADAGRIVGAVVMFPTVQGENVLHKIMVDPQWRGRGIGTQLMHAVLSRADAPVLLTVDPANEAAVELYRKFGFQIRETVRGYYRPHEDRHIMVHDPGDALERNSRRR